MKGNCDSYPEIFISTIGKIQFRYNIRKTVRKDIKGNSRECYDYDYVNIDKLTKKNLLYALKDIEGVKEIVENAFINEEI
uniref:Uncharacterized protein n=1 Tax=viral metagenome TaxID=1070528 RepID=A0A6M3K779_9ZZZZ